MDPIRNPYAPGAGALPPALEGRDDIRDQMKIAVSRTQILKPAKSAILVGLRGVGKTVLLEQLRLDTESERTIALWTEAPEDRSLPSMLAPKLRSALLKLSRSEQAKGLAAKGLRALAGFVSGLKVKYQDIEVGLDYEPEPGLADNGDLEMDLQELFETVGRAAAADDKAIVLFVDELQYVAEDQLAALITALHRCSQRKLPVIMVGAGLPQLRGRMGRAKSYAERLFDFPMIGALDAKAATAALAKPAAEEGVDYAPGAIAHIIERTEGYPYFLQEWGKHSWDIARETPIQVEEVRYAGKLAVEALDQSFFRVRFDRLTPLEKRYLRSMAELGAGPHRSGEIAALLHRRVESLAPTRNNLISKGMIWSPNHGDTAFTVPLFDRFMLRIIPDDSWQTADA